MNRFLRSRWGLAGAAVLLVAAGAAAMYLVMRASAPDTGQPAAGPAANTAEVAHAPSDGQTIVTLSDELLERADLDIVPATSGSASASLRLPGVVMPNAYRDVAVTPLVPGRVTRVLAELGQRVRQGQTLAEVYSPELAEAQTRYAAARAALDAHARELQRTQKLAAIGAASTQELERVHADHTAQEAAVKTAEARLRLLGVPAAVVRALAAGEAVAASASVPAPIAGTVTARMANVGLNVDPAMQLFTIVDLSTVWVVADLHERDLSHARVGTFAAVTAPAYPDVVWRGRISYVDPQVSPDTRTAKVRVELSNPEERLRLGMFVDVALDTPDAAPAVMIPRAAVQAVGDGYVVYVALPGEPGRFAERAVRIGKADGDAIEVVEGLQAGDRVVAKGSFFVRAEVDRLGLRKARPDTAQTAQVQQDAAAPAVPVPVTVAITEKGFEPAHVSVAAGRPVRITFTRKTDQTCATEVVFPSLDIRRALPLDTPVTIEWTPESTGDVAFVCGMNMLRGTVVVE